MEELEKNQTPQKPLKLKHFIFLRKSLQEFRNFKKSVSLFLQGGSEKKYTELKKAKIRKQKTNKKQKPLKKRHFIFLRESLREFQNSENRVSPYFFEAHR